MQKVEATVTASAKGECMEKEWKLHFSGICLRQKEEKVNKFFYSVDKQSDSLSTLPPVADSDGVESDH